MATSHAHRHPRTNFDVPRRCGGKKGNKPINTIEKENQTSGAAAAAAAGGGGLRSSTSAWYQGDTMYEVQMMSADSVAPPRDGLGVL